MVLTQSQNPHLIHNISPQPPTTINSVMPRSLMEVVPLHGVFLCLSGVLLCLWLGLVVLILSIFSLSFVLWVGATPS